MENKVGNLRGKKFNHCNVLGIVIYYVFITILSKKAHALDTK